MSNMPAVEKLLLQLADLATKIDNVRSLLESNRPTRLEDSDRENAHALLAKLLHQKAVLESNLRAMMKKGNDAA